MSGSPKYSIVTYDARRRERIERARAARAEQRRKQEVHRQNQERERLQRLADQARPATRAAITAVQSLVAELADRAGTQFGPTLNGLASELNRAASKASTASADDQADLVRHAERVRTQLSEIKIRVAIAEGVAERTEVVKALREILQSVDQAGSPEVADQVRQAGQELDQLAAAAAEDDGFAFDVRRGTSEAAVNRVLWAATSAAEQQRAEQQKRSEARSRLEAMTERVRAAASDAAASAADELELSLRNALTAADDALLSGPTEQAAAVLDDLERQTAEAEALLDELVLAAEQRTELARALKEAMEGQGLLFLGGEDHGQALTLNFQRANGAVYWTAIESGDTGTEGAMLTYRIAGEPDMADETEVAVAGDRVCTDAEALLNRVHEDLPDEFHAGSLVWSGRPKPPIGGWDPDGRRRHRPIPPSDQDGVAAGGQSGGVAASGQSGAVQNPPQYREGGL